MQQVIETETTSNDQHQAFVQFRCYIEQYRVVILELQTVVFNIIYCPNLLLIKEFPYFENTL